MSPLMKLGALAASMPDVKVRVAGYADPRGSEKVNDELSRRRAEAVAEVLAQAGVAKDHMIVEGHGKAESTSMEGDVDGYAFDRKVTVGGRMTYVVPTVPLGTPDALLAYTQAPYSVFGLYTSIALNENLTGRINVDNLFDKAYVDALGVPTYPAPGRTVTFSLQGKF